MVIQFSNTSTSTLNSARGWFKQNMWCLMSKTTSWLQRMVQFSWFDLIYVLVSSLFIYPLFYMSLYLNLILFICIATNATLLNMERWFPNLCNSSYLFSGNYATTTKSISKSQFISSPIVSSQEKWALDAEEQIGKAHVTKIG